MFAQQFRLPVAMRSQVVPILEDSGCQVTSLDVAPVYLDGVFWQRLECRAGDATAIIVIGDRAGRPDWFIVAVSLDLRRVLSFWKLRKDVRLVRKIREVMVSSGAKTIDSGQ
jgi:hypothetical protein